MRWDIAPHLVLVQSRLFSPGYAGPGRWVVFQPRERRAFSAIGPDVVPDIIRILAKACGGASADDLASVVPQVDSKQILGLTNAGLLVESFGEASSEEESYIANYHLASYNYPFQDYVDPLWREKEEKLLGHYDALWPPPPSVAERNGHYYPLPAGDLAHLEKESGVSTLAWVSSLLRYTFGPIGEIRTSRLTCLRRTSPSGGARHPTEGAIVLPEPLEDIPAGSYIYDVARHGLVELPEEFDLAQALKGVGKIGIVIRTRVERAMWRYRELRAWRPVLLDAGHIIETLSLLLARRGLNSYVVSPRPSRESDLTWLNEADLAVVIASKEALVNGFRWTERNGGETSSGTQEYLTNPAMYLSFRPGGLRTQTIWPRQAQAEIDLVGFRILSHCLPSNRGDRITTLDGVLNAVEGAAKSDVTHLAKAGALLPRSEAARIYDAARLWVRHSWYLSLLAHMAAAAHSESFPASNITSCDFLGSLDTLMTRRTTRRFLRTPVPVEKIKSILIRALRGSSVPGLRVVVGSLDVTGLETGIYEWDIRHSVLGPAIGPLARADARNMAVGQEPVENAAVIIVLTRIVDTSEARQYEMDIMDLGRLGQRLCLLAEQSGLGVFLTPAVADEQTLKTLMSPEPTKTIAYLFALGNKKVGLNSVRNA